MQEKERRSEREEKMRRRGEEERGIEGRSGGEG